MSYTPLLLPRGPVVLVCDGLNCEQSLQIDGQQVGGDNGPTLEALALGMGWRWAITCPEGGMADELLCPDCQKGRQLR